MRMTSVITPIANKDKTIEFLVSHGATIFRVKDVVTTIPGLGKQVTHLIIIFYTSDDSDLTALKLKHPHGVFKDLSA